LICFCSRRFHLRSCCLFGTQTASCLRATPEIGWRVPADVMGFPEAGGRLDPESCPNYSHCAILKHISHKLAFAATRPPTNVSAARQEAVADPGKGKHFSHRGVFKRIPQKVVVATSKSQEECFFKSFGAQTPGGAHESLRFLKFRNFAMSRSQFLSSIISYHHTIPYVPNKF